MDQIGLFFKCQSCSDYALTCNIQCPNGHQVCQGCFENLSHCPTCHQRVAPSTRIPFLLTTNVDPILNMGDSFDLLLPSLIRIAPALHPCSPDEMIYTSEPQDSNLTLSMNNETDLQKNGNINDQLLISNNNEVEETLSRLMMLASMSPGPITTTTSQNNAHVPPPGLVGTPPPSLQTTSQPMGIINNQQQVDRFTEF